MFSDLTTLENPTSPQANEISDAVAVVEFSDEDPPEEVYFFFDSLFLFL